MPNPNKEPAKSAKQLADEAELERMMKEEEEAKAAALASLVDLAPAPLPPPDPKADIKVLCLKDENWVRLGGRSYIFKKGTEIKMHPDHAEEMEQSGWVVRKK